MGTRVDLDGVEKRKHFLFLSGIEPPLSSPWLYQYTDRATLEEMKSLKLPWGAGVAQCSD